MVAKFGACLLLLATSIHALASPVSPISQLKAQSPVSASEAALADAYPAHTISIPVDHFQKESRYEPHSNETFELRYWFDAQHYKKGGPVIVLHAGETDGAGRLPFLQNGILAQLAEGTNGIGVVMEHRYYGESIPTKDFSTKSLRFLTTEQALADSAYFAQNVVFKGFEKEDLTAPSTPYIVYGGSYAGGQVAFLRKEYPKVFWGAIASSGVTKAIYHYWEYFEPTRKFAPQKCVKQTQTFTKIIDKIARHKKNSHMMKEVKELFGLGDVVHNTDFVNVLSNGIGGWQGTNWDPELNDPSFSEYCDAITCDELEYPATPEQKKIAEKMVRVGGHRGSPSQTKALVTRLLNYGGYINATYAAPCVKGGQTTDECFTSYDMDFYKKDDLEQSWRLWAYQYCTEWGYLQTGSTPFYIQPLISRLIDLKYTSLICREAFDIHKPSDVDRVNKYGGYNIREDRLAYIDGKADPWRVATAHSIHAKKRKNTTKRPFIMIDDAVHHWDENGVWPNQTTPDFPPPRIQKVQAEELRFVKAWLKEWDHAHKHG